MDNRKLTTEHTESTEKLTAKGAKNAKILKGFFLATFACFAVQKRNSVVKKGLYYACIDR